MPAVVLSACPGSPAPSGLEQRNATPTPVPQDSPSNPPKGPSGGPSAGPAPAATPSPPAAVPGQLTAEPPAGTELIPVRLALKEGSVYQITTIAMVSFTSVKPSGFAREERIELDQCEGEGDARHCRLSHSYVHFEAEPPNGRIFEGDERKVDKLVTRHTLRSNGARDGETEVSGPAEQQSSPEGLALHEVHRFFCIRFPDVPIGVGAKWKDVCHMRTGGVVDTREVIWELTRVSTDEQGRRRADFTYLGNYLAPGEQSPRTGTVQGILHFFLDVGEPHLIKEQIVTRRDPQSRFETVTSATYQFGKFSTDKQGKPIVVRSDGEPFPEAAPAVDANMTPAPTAKSPKKQPKTKPAEKPAAK
ncbi:hypothetical protein [Nannocystis sp.]|uniref:hypothetical protein n=1 Tax=Nannocystis sp. TaxID=1962667 RepID=UPI0025D59D87|nr:hypothetical protein [Nannocystis sp.]MBK7827464.1 hypothetical protein [Nannocystis sp.]